LRAASISASISSRESRSKPCSFALFQRSLEPIGAEGVTMARMLIASLFSEMERPERASIAVFWSGERSLAL
jgi:hypothetical protein